jgi:hypothetical protein
MADLRISELAALAGADLAANDLLPVADLSASETKKITVTDFTGRAITLIADATIPGAKILFGSSQVPGSALQDSAVSTAKIADDAVTAAKLGNESTVDLVTTLPASGAFVGQLALDTDDLKVYCWNGSTWQSIKAAGSINAVVGDSSGIVNISVVTSGDTVTISTTLDNTSAAGQFLAGPSGSAGAVSYRAITGADLPAPTTTSRGGVAVNGNGLALSGSAIVVDNNVTANTSAHHLVQYTSKGLITGGRTIQAGDLPIAGATTVGAARPGSGLSVDLNGTFNHTNSVVGGTYAKVTVDAQGHVSAGQSLVADDIPNIPASKLTSGTLSTSLVGTNSLTGDKLANYATVKLGGAGSTSGIVTFPTADFAGQQFFDATNGDLYLYDGNTWQPITVISGDLVYAGTYNAATNQVKSVTTQGSAAGFVAGASLPAASATNVRYYVVVSDSGTGVSPAPVVALAPPDMLVSNGATYDLVDVSNAIAGQTASNISFTPYGNLAANNVQVALQELDDEKLAKAGGTVTGNLEIGSTGSLTFEGSSADANETTLAVVNPTADRTITLPDVSGTVVTTGDTGTVTSTMIANGTIVDADINASAAIVDTKLATISTAGKVANSATTAASANTANAIVSRDASGNFSASTITATFNGTTFLGTTSLALNRASGNQPLTGISSIALPGATSGTVTLTPAATAGTTAITLPATTGTLITTGDTGTVTGTMIADNTIVNAEVASNAAIAGTKISPDFGAQNVTTTGTSTAASFIPTSSTVPTNGVYLSAAGSVSIATGSTQRLLIDSNGQIEAAGLGTAAAPAYSWVGDPNTGIYSPGADQVAISTNGTERMRLDSSGRVGIGTTSPTEILHIVSNSGSVPLFEHVTSSALRLTKTVTGTESRIQFANTADTKAAQMRINWAQDSFGAFETWVPNNTSNGQAIVIRASTDNTIFYGSAAGTERARIDSSGRLLVGTSSSAWDSLIEVARTTGSQFTGFRYSNDSFPSEISLHKSRGSLGANTIVANGDVIGILAFRAADGSTYRQAASITAAVDGEPGAADMPGRLVFATTADGASSPTERMRISNNGRVTLANSSVGTPTALTDAATVAVDLSLANHFTLTLGGNRTLGAPTNATAGQSGVIVITQDATGSRTLAYNSIFKFPGGTAPTLTTAANAVDILVYYVESATRISARLISDAK